MGERGTLLRVKNANAATANNAIKIHRLEGLRRGRAVGGNGFGLAGCLVSIRFLSRRQSLQAKKGNSPRPSRFKPWEFYPAMAESSTAVYKLPGAAIAGEQGKRRPYPPFFA